MADITIRVDNLSKLYRIGQRERYKTLRDTFTDAMYAPFRAIRSALNGRRSSVSGIKTTDDGRRTTAENSENLAVGSQEAAVDSRIWALKDVSFEVKRGEVVGIIGRNGAGKSTLLKILSRITEPTEGQAEIHGRVGSLLEVGTGFHAELTGRENIFLNGAILGMKRVEIERKFDEIVAFSEVEKFIDTPVKYYSSGMYVRLAFAVAAHMEPEILLVDEVLAVGDGAFQKKCLGKVEDVSKEGRTVLFVSHNMGVITHLCKRALLLEEGKLVTDGSAFQVVERYQSAHLTNCAHWERPQSLPISSEFSFISATARGEDGKIHLIFRVEQPIHIELVYKVHRPLTDCAVGVSFTNAMGIIIFSTADSGDQSIPRAPGIYRGKFVVPDHFLSPGRYTVSFYAHLPGKHTYDVFYDALTLEVSRSGAVEAWDRNKPVVAPRFAWHTVKVEEENGNDE